MKAWFPGKIGSPHQEQFHSCRQGLGGRNAMLDPSFVLIGVLVEAKSIKPLDTLKKLIRHPCKRTL